MSIAASLALMASAAIAAQEVSRSPVGAQSPREIYQALNGLRVDSSRVYPVSEIRLRREGVNLTLSSGTIGFVEPYAGQVSGVVFSGRGHVTANLRDSAEKQSLAHFVSVPLLDQSFSGAYIRFDDGSAEEILEQLRHNGTLPAKDDRFVASWNSSMANLNPDESARLLLDMLAETPAPFFYAELLDERIGAFDILVDSRRTDSVMIGQDRWSAGNRYYDVWASFSGRETPAPLTRAFAPQSYTIETTIEQDRSLKGTTTIELRTEREGERGVGLELSRFLKLQSVEDADGHPLDFLQNETLNRNQLEQHGNDFVFVFLPERARKGQSYRIRLSYSGSVITDAGDGVYFVGDRGAWYPHVGAMGQFATYDTTFRWPRKLQLVATGEKIDEHEEGDVRVGRWRSDGPAPISGFNLGEYVVQNIETSGGVKIEVAANPALENLITQHVRPQSIVGPSAPITIAPHRRVGVPPTFSDESPVPAASALKEVGQEIADAIRFEQQWLGPFPHRRLVVSQASGAVGRGFPGLVYLPSLSFVPVIEQQTAGVTLNSQQSLNAIVPFHEVAHQWWGNVVGWEDYRDQWLTEGLANYVALVGADAQTPSAHMLAQWLDRYRKTLITPSPAAKAAEKNDAPEFQDARRNDDATDTPDDAGPLVYGFRLNSSRDPDAYRKVIYGKGTWVFHMLRMMMQEPGSKSPDERFVKLLRGILESYRYRALSTGEFQKEVERAMTPAMASTMAIEGGHSMDWFFEQYVKSTGIPSYEVKYSVRPVAKGFQVRGKLIQKNVPDSFVLRVPIYSQAQGTKPVLLGHVVTSGDETSFQFLATLAPKKLLIDPQMTLLCVTSTGTAAAPAAE
jgi:hypothetical protein